MDLQRRWMYADQSEIEQTVYVFAQQQPAVFRRRSMPGVRTETCSVESPLRMPTRDCAPGTELLQQGGAERGVPDPGTDDNGVGPTARLFPPQLDDVQGRGVLDPAKLLR